MTARSFSARQTRLEPANQPKSRNDQLDIRSQESQKEGHMQGKSQEPSGRAISSLRPSWDVREAQCAVPSICGCFAPQATDFIPRGRLLNRWFLRLRRGDGPPDEGSERAVRYALLHREEAGDECHRVLRPIEEPHLDGHAGKTRGEASEFDSFVAARPEPQAAAGLHAFVDGQRPVLTGVLKYMIPAAVGSVAQVRKKVRDPAGGRFVAIGFLRLVNRLPKLPRGMPVRRQHEFVEDGAETRDPPFEFVRAEHLDARADALPVFQRTFKGDLRYTANADHFIIEVGREGIHESYFAGGADGRCGGGKIANQGFMQHGVRRFADLRRNIRDGGLEVTRSPASDGGDERPASLVANQPAAERFGIRGHVMAEALRNHEPDGVRGERQRAALPRITRSVLAEGYMHGVDQRMAIANRTAAG